MKTLETSFTQMITEATSTREKIWISAVWLFSSQGADRVGIRELCRSVNIKESSFYNHFASKNQLLEEIFSRYLECANQTILTVEEVDEIVDREGVDGFFGAMMEKFLSVTANPLFQTMRRIVLMESFINPTAAEIAGKNMYSFRKESMERGLRRMMQKGLIKDIDVDAVIIAYCYAASELLDEYLLLDNWNQDAGEIQHRLVNHVRFFTNLLKKG